jgi:hypothetical protein
MSEPVSGSSRDFFHDFFTTESISTDRVTGLIIETLKASYSDEQIREFTSKAKLSAETPIDIAIASILKQAPQMPIQEHLKQRLLALNDLDPAVALPQVKEIIEVAKRAGLTILDLDIDRLNAALIGKISQEIAHLRLLKAVVRGTTYCKDVPREKLTETFVFAFVSKKRYGLRYIPILMRTPEICLAAVNQDGCALEYVPIRRLTVGMVPPEICLSAVTENGLAIEYFPIGMPINIGMRTRDICLAAVNQNGYALKYVPEEIRTRDICLAAVIRNGGALEYVPKAMITPEICLAAVSRCGGALGYVPKAMITPEICLAAVSLNGFALQYVPEEMRTLDICLAAITKNIEALIHVVDVKGVLEFGLSTIHLGGLEMSEGFNVIKDILNYTSVRF